MTWNGVRPVQRRRRKGAIATIAVAALLGVFSGTALGARGDACGTGVCGSATFTWASDLEMYPISMSVKDTGCDGHPVYIRFIVYNHGSTSGWRTTKRWNSSGCQAGYVTWNNLRLHDSNHLIAVKVEACVDDAGNDTCYTSVRLNSPFW